MREQKQKPRNEEWMRARVQQSNRNNTVPSKKRAEDRRRRPKHMKKGWE